MRRLYIILNIVIFLLPLSAAAQSLTNSERRHINSKVLTVVEEYERLATLYDDDASYYFQSLFAKEGETGVFCDMIGAPSYLKTVPVSEYVSMLREYASNVTTVIRDVSKGRMTYSDGIWHIPVTFSKSLSYIDKNGYMFSVEDYHDTEFDMTMHLSYDQERDVCLIESIEGKIKGDKKFPEGRFLIVNEVENPSDRYMKHFSTLKLKGATVDYNEFGQAILPNGNAEVYDIDMAVIADTLASGFNYDVVSYNFKRRKARMKLRYNYAPEGIYQISMPDANKDYVNASSKAMEAGWDIGFAFPFGRRTKMGFYTGVGLCMSELNFSLKSPISYSYATSSYNNVTGYFDNVDVTYKITDAHENVRYMDIFVPVYMEMEHRLGRHVLLSWDVGVKAYWNLAVQNVDPERLPPYSVTYSTNVSVNGNGTQRSSLATYPVAFVESNGYKRTNIGLGKTEGLSAVGNIGLDINLVKRKWYLMLRVGYEYGLGLLSESDMIYSSETNAYFEKNKHLPIIYDPVDNEDIHVHSLISGAKFRREGLWVSGGFKFKM